MLKLTHGDQRIGVGQITVELDSDTSHLCSDINKVKSMLCHRVLDERRERLINAGGNKIEIIDNYLNYISRKLTRIKLIKYGAANTKS